MRLLNQKIISEYTRMEEFVETDIYPVFNELDNKINESDFTDEMKREIRAKVAFGICQTTKRSSVLP